MLTPGPFTDAASAAAAVLNATDDNARTVAVLSILQAIGVGVYTPDGAPVVVGAERGDADFWMYDFQAAALAASVRDGDAIRLEDIAADLVEIAAANGGGPVTVADILGAVAAAAASVDADPGLDRGLALGVALELGRQGRFHTDLARPVDGEPVVLDGLSAFLVTADLVLPVIASQDVAAAADRRTASLAFVAAVPSGCPSGMGGANGWIAGVAAGRVGGLAGVTNASFDRYLQGQLTGATVAAWLEGPPSWHHRHEDSTGAVDGAEEEYHFSIRLRTTAPTTPIRCGALSGTSFPSAGEIVGADVAWQYPPRLLDHAPTIHRDNKTDALGIATLSVDPETERYPSAIGPIQRDRITITAGVNVLQALGGDLYSHLAGVPALQRRSLDIDVEWHQTYAVDVDVASVLTVTRGNTYNGELGVTTASGTIPVIEFRNAADPPSFRGAEIINPGILTTSASPPRTRGHCNTEWIEEKSGTSRAIDWQVFDLAIWPPEEISLQMDTGRTYEEPDSYDGLLCPPGGNIRLGPSPGNVWETMLFLSYPGGLKFKGTGQNKWTIDSSPDVWVRGGELAKWHTDETCGGRCKGVLEISIKIRPLP